MRQRPRDQKEGRARLASLLLAVLMFSLTARPANAETVYVKYRGLVDLTPFDCKFESRSSLINRICYDAANEYMIIQLREIYYHYCEIDAGTVVALKTAESMGRYYKAYIKGSGQDGPFDCRTHRVPKY